jgi:hypothetical protein
VSNYAEFFATFNPPAATVRQHHKQMMQMVRAREGEKACKLADEYLKKGFQQILGLPSSSS